MYKYFLLSLLSCVFIGAQGQSIKPFVISSGGNYFKNADYSVSYTIGEIFTPTIESGNTIITQGFQQPSDNQFISVPEFNNLSSLISLYPNPFGNQLNIKMEISEPESFEVLIFDIAGRIVQEPTLISTNYDAQLYSFNTNHLMTGVYIIKIINVHTAQSADFKLTKL